MSLVITKQSGNFFSLVLDGGTPIISEQNRLTTIGNLCNFKTANGANLVLKQNILVTEITVIASGTFTFTTTNQLWNKLIEIGFFDGISGTSGGSAIDRFDELSDTFNYFGRDRQVVVVNESQQKLETQEISFFSAEDRVKLDGIQAEAEVNVQADWNETDPKSDAFIANKPPISSYFSAIYIERFIANGAVNTFTLPIGAQAVNLYIDRGVRYKVTEWTQTDNIVTILGDILQSGSDVYITGMQA
jgi:hypothetical protein